MLCAFSRWLCERSTGARIMLCSHLFWVGSPRVRLLDLIMWPRDLWLYGETRLGHCARCAEFEGQGWGVSDRVDRRGL